MILLIERLTLSNHVNHCIQDPEIRMHDLKKITANQTFFAVATLSKTNFLAYINYVVIQHL